MSSDYESIDEIRRMQQEAVKRVQEMQKRAKISLEYSNSGIDSNREKLIKNEIGKITNEKNNISEPLNEKEFQKNVLAGIVKDPEKCLILLLILLLADENADIWLVLVLAYIMF